MTELTTWHNCKIPPVHFYKTGISVTLDPWWKRTRNWIRTGWDKPHNYSFSSHILLSKRWVVPPAPHTHTTVLHQKSWSRDALYIHFNVQLKGNANIFFYINYHIFPKILHLHFFSYYIISTVFFKLLINEKLNKVCLYSPVSACGNKHYN